MPFSRRGPQPFPSCLYIGIWLNRMTGSLCVATNDDILRKRYEAFFQNLLLVNLSMNSSERPEMGVHSSTDILWPCRKESSSAYPGASNMTSVWLASDISKLGSPKWDVYRVYACGEKDED